MQIVNLRNNLLLAASAAVGPFTFFTSSLQAQEVPTSRLTAASITSTSSPKTTVIDSKAVPNPPTAGSAEDRSFRLNEEGVELVFQGKKDEGLAKIKEALALSPKNHTALYNLAGLYVSSGNAPEAVKIMEQALAIQPTDTAFLNRAAEAHFLNSDVKKAIATYEQLVKIDPTFEQAQYRLGSLHAMQKNWDFAESALRKALAQSKDDARVLNSLGTVLVMRSKFADSITFLERAQKSSPSNETSMSLGIAYEGLNKPAQALKHYQEAINLGSTDETLKKRIDELKSGSKGQ